MASAVEVSEYRARHTVAQTAQHFGISERMVYKHLGAVARPPRVVARPAAPVAPAVLEPVYADLPDDIAGDNTSWRCPVTGGLFPVVPGSRRHGWMAERRALFARRAELFAPAAVADPEPAPAVVEVVAAADPEPALPEPVPLNTALQCDIALSEPVRVLAPAIVTAQHNMLFAWLAEYWRVPLALVVALFVIWCCYG